MVGRQIRLEDTVAVKMNACSCAELRTFEYSDIRVTMHRRHTVTLVFVATLLCGCEPLRGVVSEKDIPANVDLACVDATLRRTFGTIERWDYVDDGFTYPKGAKVAQFAYYNTKDGAGWATLHIGRVDGQTRIAHQFTGSGAELPQRSFPPALWAMEIARQALQASCNIDLSGMNLVAVGQNVEALK